MMMPFFRTVPALALCLIALATTAPNPAGAQTIGTVGSAEPTLRGTPPGAATRALTLGTGLVHNETVSSSETGRGQLLFLDQTTLSLAPNTTIVLDRFVFDPDGGGQIGLQLTTGALRFIGGTLSRDEEAVVRTPTASIGVRGSSALIIHAGGETITVFLAGERLCLSNTSAQRFCTSRQGAVVTEDGYQGRVNPAFLARLLELIDGAPLSGGGNAPGTGVGAPNPSDRGPVSTTGEEFDPMLFDEDFTFDDLVRWLNRPNDGGPVDDFCQIYPLDC